MSMISSLIDELRKSADEWNGSNMFELARMCREAADTIWELRDDLQRANAENSKLREELAKARDPQRIGGQADPSSFVYAIEQLREFRWQHATNDEDAIPYINGVADAHERENDRLRELCAEFYKFSDSMCTQFNDCSHCLFMGEDGVNCKYLELFQRICELGIEVDA